jgi:hypothetical protein
MRVTMRECGVWSAREAEDHGVPSAVVTEMGVEAVGFMLCYQDDGRRLSVFTYDSEYVQALGASNPGWIRIPSNKFPLRRPGWPEDWLPGGDKEGQSGKCTGTSERLPPHRRWPGHPR